MSRKVDFRFLMESSLEDLVQSADTRAESDLLECYRALLLAFYKGDSLLAAAESDRLQELVREEKAPAALASLGTLRLQVLLGNPDPKRVRELQARAAEEGEWEGEILIVCGAAHEARRDLEKAEVAYREARGALLRVGCPRKALRAALNETAMMSQRDPARKLMIEFHSIYRQAKKLREYRSAGIALSNIAREYRNIGALEVALKHVDRAVRYLTKEIGSLHYYKALVNRCYILFELDRQREAELDFEEARLADFSEIRAALALIEKLRDPRAEVEVRTEDLAPMWRERLLEGRSMTRSQSKLGRGKLGVLEEAVIRLLCDGPRDKFELIVAIYGTREDFFATEARLKALLGRLRKKAPGLIIFEEGKYRISDRILVPSFLREAG